jgi:hypothetical protein
MEFDLHLLPLSQKASEAQEIVRKSLQDFSSMVRQTPLAVMVWGPGQQDRELFGKRIQIINRLRELDVYAFGSDVEPPDIDSMFIVCQKDIEYLQGLAVDLIILLRCSYGSVAELHDVLPYRELVAKTVVYMDRETLASYSSQVAISEIACKVELYDHEDILACKLIGRIEKLVDQIRMIKFKRERDSHWKW